MKKLDLCRLIREFALKQRGRFDFEKLEKYVSKKQKGFEDFDRLFDLTCESEFLFEDDSDSIKNFFVPRHCFFKGAEFRVKPLPEEVEGGFLIPGHRFIPFIALDVFSVDATLKLTDDSVAAKRQVKLPYDTAARVLIYFGQYGMIDYLVHDNKLNAALIQPPFDKPLDMTAFDMREFYEQCGFKAGDSLMLKVEDWLKGVFSVRHIPAKGKTVDFALTHDWVKALRDGFEKMRIFEKPNYDCTEQMAWMFYYVEVGKDSQSVLTNPPLSIPDFFKKQKDLTMKTLGQVNFFWPVDEPVEQRLLDCMDDEEPEPDTELDALFQMMNLSLHSEDAEAYMRDAIASGNTDSATVLERVLAGRDLYFPTEILQYEFIDLWEELWGEVHERYNPEGDRFRKVRSVFLELNDKCLKILRDMDKADVDPQTIISNPDYLQLS